MEKSPKGTQQQAGRHSSIGGHGSHLEKQHSVIGIYREERGDAKKLELKDKSQKLKLHPIDNGDELHRPEGVFRWSGMNKDRWKARNDPSALPQVGIPSEPKREKRGSLRMDTIRSLGVVLE